MQLLRNIRELLHALPMIKRPDLLRNPLKSAKRFPRRHLMLAITVVFSLALISLWSPSQQLSAKRQNFSLDLKPVADTDTKTPDTTEWVKEENWEEITVEKGDNLSRIFSRNALSPTELYNFANSGKQAADLKYIKPGDQLQLVRTDDNKLLKFRYQKDILTTQLWQLTDGKFVFSEKIKTPEIKITYRESIIEQSL